MPTCIARSQVRAASRSLCKDLVLQSCHCCSFLNKSIINWQAAVSSEGTRTIKGGDGSTHAFWHVLGIKDPESIHVHPWLRN